MERDAPSKVWQVVLTFAICAVRVYIVLWAVGCFVKLWSGLIEPIGIAVGCGIGEVAWVYSVRPFLRSMRDGWRQAKATGTRSERR